MSDPSSVKKRKRAAEGSSKSKKVAATVISKLVEAQAYPPVVGTLYHRVD